jgi:hypothetical protein
MSWYRPYQRLYRLVPTHICIAKGGSFCSVPTKPSHLDFEKSTLSEDDMPMMMKLGYFGEAESKLVQFAGQETTPTPKNDEVVVLRASSEQDCDFL